MNPILESNAFSFLLGIAALAIAQAVVYLKMRPKKLPMRDYYDVYYNHCSNCSKDGAE